ARYIAVSKPRERVLSREEVGEVMRLIYRSSMRTANKVALHLLLLTMARKTELTQARWEDVDFDGGEWTIPETKNGKAHVVYLSDQAKALFADLKTMAGESPWVLPSRS